MIDRSALAQLWWQLMQIPAAQFFAGQPERMVVGPSPHGTTMSPGYVGRDYDLGGWLLVGNYPAGGTASYIERPNPTDQRLYGSFISLAAADTDEARLARFEALSATWIELQRTHQIYRTLFLPLFRAGGKTDQDVAFLNAFPFRCRDNKAPTIGMYSTAWKLTVSRQIEVLQPGKVIALGMAAGRAIERFLRGSADLVVLERSNGDRYLKDSAQRAIEQLACDSENPRHPLPQQIVPAKAHRRPPAQPALDQRPKADEHADTRPGASSGELNRHPTVAEYQRLLDRLGLKATRGHTLKKGTRPIPSLFFNFKGDQEVFFTGYKRHSRFYPSDLWERLAPRQAKDDQPQLITVRPKVGKASEAFEDWLRRI